MVPSPALFSHQAGFFSEVECIRVCLRFFAHPWGIKECMSVARNGGLGEARAQLP
jgi:hypothetical protein